MHFKKINSAILFETSLYGVYSYKYLLTLDINYIKKKKKRKRKRKKKEYSSPQLSATLVFLLENKHLLCVYKIYISYHEVVQSQVSC